MYIIHKRRLIFIFILIMILSSFLYTVSAVSKSEKQELIDLLNEYKGDLGNLNEFKQVVDKTYNDLHSTTNVDDSLKETLREDIELLDTITGINPLIVTVLKVELDSQVNSLNNDNLEEMQEEIAIIKEWTDEQVGESSNNIDNDYPSDNPNNDSDINYSPEEQTNDSNPDIPVNTLPSQGINQVNTPLPHTGSNSIIIISIVFLVISAIVSIIRYKQFKDVK